MISDDFHIMGIDPGTRNIGVSIFTLNGKLQVIGIITFNLNVDIETDTGIHDTLLDRTSKLYRLITSLYYIYNPSMVSIESSFINSRMLGAVIPLTKAIGAIESAIFNMDKYAKVISIPPGVIKKLFDAKQVGKDAVTDALLKHTELMEFVNTKVMTEHEIDAIAITYSLLRYLRKSEGMTCLRYLQLQ